MISLTARSFPGQQRSAKAGGLVLSGVLNSIGEANVCFVSPMQLLS